MSPKATNVKAFGPVCANAGTLKEMAEINSAIALRNMCFPPKL
jgi:Na+/H+-translocating membrane pyrophosphatase